MVTRQEAFDAFADVLLEEAERILREEAAAQGVAA